MAAAVAAAAAAWCERAAAHQVLPTMTSPTIEMAGPTDLLALWSIPRHVYISPRRPVLTESANSASSGEEDMPV